MSLFEPQQRVFAKSFNEAVPVKPAVPAAGGGEDAVFPGAPRGHGESSSDEQSDPSALSDAQQQQRSSGPPDDVSSEGDVESDSAAPSGDRAQGSGGGNHTQSGQQQAADRHRASQLIEVLPRKDSVLPFAETPPPAAPPDPMDMGLDTPPLSRQKEKEKEKKVKRKEKEKDTEKEKGKEKKRSSSKTQEKQKQRHNSAAIIAMWWQERQQKRAAAEQRPHLDSPFSVERKLREELKRAAQAKRDANKARRKERRRQRDVLLAKRHAERVEHDAPISKRRSSAEIAAEQALHEKNLQMQRRIESNERRKKRREADTGKRRAQLEQAQEQAEAERKQQLDEARERKRQQTLSRIQDMKERHKENELKEHFHNQELRKVLQRRPLHEVNQRADEVRREEERQQLEALRKKRALHEDLMTGIHSHQRWHQERYLKERQGRIDNAASPHANAPSPSYYSGQAHELLVKERHEMKRQEELKHHEQELRRERMNKFSELVKVMYAPQGHVAEELKKLPPLPAPAQQPHPETVVKKLGNEYMRAGNNIAKAHPKQSDDSEPVHRRNTRGVLGDKYMRYAQKHAKPLHQAHYDSEERTKELRQLRKKATRLTTCLGGMLDDESVWIF